MFNDQALIKNHLEVAIFNKFGKEILNNVTLLIERLIGRDTFINNNLILNLQNLLPLSESEALFFSKFCLELATISEFTPVLLLEKIPTLSFYGLTKEVGEFLSNIKNYGARAIALFLGSDQLKTDDLLDVLEQSTLIFYRDLLSRVNQKHAEFGVVCAMLMRFSSKLETIISRDQIDLYLSICACFIKKYGAKFTEKYIQNSYKFISLLPLEENISFIDAWAAESLLAAEFIVTHPHIAFSSGKGVFPSTFNQRDNDSSNKVKIIEFLKNDHYMGVLENLYLLEDKDFSTLFLVWPELTLALKKNILFQLGKENYKNYILAEPLIQSQLEDINKVTQSKWMESWTFIDQGIDLVFIRKKIGKFLQNQCYFSLPVKTIIKKHSEIFDRSCLVYDDKRVSNMIIILIEYCIESKVKEELYAMFDFVHGKVISYRNFLSNSSLVVQTWNRDPWGDYGRSDELFSCTSFGDYNSANAPAFLADLNITNLDIWSCKERVGRIHLCLVKDLKGQVILLLDCLDGTERIIESKKKINLIINAVFDYARYLGVSYIKFNYDVDFNATPKKFISHLEKVFACIDRIDFLERFFPVSTQKYLIPYPNQTFLESFLKSNAAFVRGALLPVPKEVE